MLLILKQPDLSSSLVVAFIMVVMIFAAGLSYRIIVPIILLFVPIGIVGAWYIQQPHNGLLIGYQYNRIMSWLYPDTFPNSEKYNYQQLHSIRAIASAKYMASFARWRRC